MCFQLEELSLFFLFLLFLSCSLLPCHRSKIGGDTALEYLQTYRPDLRERRPFFFSFLFSSSPFLPFLLPARQLNNARNEKKTCERDTGFTATGKQSVEKIRGPFSLFFPLFFLLPSFPSDPSREIRQANRISRTR